MAAIDALLGILKLKNADGLVLASGEAPALLVGGGRTPLTMPPLGEETLALFLDELLSAELRDSLATQGTVEASHRSDSLGVVAVKVKRAGSKSIITIKTQGAAARRRPTDEAPRRAAVEEAPRRALVEERRSEEEEPRREAVGGGQAEGRIADLLREAAARGASDVMLSADAAPMIRVGGALIASGAPLSPEELEAWCGPLLGSRRRQLEEGGSADAGHTLSDGERVRINFFRHAGGLGAALRLIRREVPTLAGLNLPASLTSLLDHRNGLVLIAGATGTGKSTTLAALIEHLNRTRACHVITLEDPIEYQYPRRRALIHQRELGTHVDSFAGGLKAALREAPDVILVGELRDAATIRQALVAAETGHLVLSTVHAGSAAMAVGRIVDAFAESERAEVRQQLASTARALVTQQLVSAVDGSRLPVLELVMVNHAIASQIRDSRTHMLSTQIELGADEGMVPMERALLELVRAGRISRQTALQAAPDRAALSRLLDERR
jgi:twitching motility protein PilT